MLSFFRSKRVVNIVIDDYVLRAVENNGTDLESIKIVKEKPLPTGIIENGIIQDELAFYELLKEVIKEWDIKNRNVRFYVPNSLIIMRDINLSKNIPENELKQHITMEIGNSIHFPFKYPVFDIYTVMEQEENKQKLTLLAAPEEEILKYANVFADVSLHPVAVDVQALGAYRFYHKLYEQGKEETNLFFEINLTSTNISVFSNFLLEFLRYQPLNVQAKDWESTQQANGEVDWSFVGDETHLQHQIEDQLSELDRIMNFYQYSLHQGQKSITNIQLIGDYPYLNEVAATMETRFTVNVNVLEIEQGIIEQHVNNALIPALGLALKGDN